MNLDPYKTVVFVHVLSGMSAFVVAPIAMLVKKGSKAHRQWGKLFFWSMTGVVITGIVMSIVLTNIFLFCVAFFAYSLVVSGYRWLYRKKNTPGQKIATLDWVINIVSIVFDIGLVTVGVLRILSNVTDAFGYISIVFGLIGMNFTYGNFKQYLKPPKEKNAWLLNHIGGMIGGYIATVSAFSAVNLNALPTIIRWLWPTIIGIPLMTIWINYYKRKFAAGKKVEELVVVKEFID
jgi:hypothetical protein